MNCKPGFLGKDSVQVWEENKFVLTVVVALVTGKTDFLQEMHLMQTTFFTKGPGRSKFQSAQSITLELDKTLMFF